MNAHPSARGQTVPQLAVALGAIAVVGVAFAMLVSNPPVPAGGGVKPSPSAPIVATPRPSEPASPASPSPASPSPSSPAKPSASPSSDPVSVIELDSASGHDVKADVIDQIGSLVSARSGKPGDGMSVRWHDSIVRQAGPQAIEVTWVAFARDEHIGIGIHDLDGPLTVVIVQGGPYPDTDALGEDRVVILSFDHPVVASDVAVEILDRTVDE
jgi:hypothetical protein